MKNFIPKKNGFFFPGEWETHDAVWLSWIHNKKTFFNKIKDVIHEYCMFIQEVVKSEIVRINVSNNLMEKEVKKNFLKYNIDLNKVEFFYNKTDDTWIRDYGPAFLVNSNRTKKIIIDWEYNAWGNKYLFYKFDNSIPNLIGKQINIPVIKKKIILEGGSIEFNGSGSILTSRACLLNKNRNFLLNKKEIENILCNYYGQEEVLWVSNGIVGDDTDGHIDCTVRFINKNTVIAGLENNKFDANYYFLRENLKALNKLKILNKDPINIVEIPMPNPIYYNNIRLPASYLNFYIANHAVIVPIFENKYDDKALEIIQSCFPKKQVIGIRSLSIISGLGSFHCLTQQEPKIIKK